MSIFELQQLDSSTAHSKLLSFHELLQAHLGIVRVRNEAPVDESIHLIPHVG